MPYKDPAKRRKVARLSYYRHKETRCRRVREYRLQNLERIQLYDKERYNRARDIALKIVGRGHTKCVYCGRSNINILEINHKNGGGTKEGSNDRWFLTNIISGKRSIDDLELTCRVCNICHYADMLAKQYPLIRSPVC